MSEEGFLINIKTHEAIAFKHLAGLYHNILTVVPITVNKKTMKVYCQNSKKTILLETILKSEKFETFEINNDDDNDFLMVVSAKYFNILTKAIKVKDVIKFYVAEGAEDSLTIRLENPNKNKCNTKKLKIIQDYDDPKEYIKPPAYDDHNPTVVISSSEFQSMAKTIKNISDTAILEVQDKGIRFSSSDNKNDDIFSDSTEFGIWRKNKDILYKQVFSSKDLYRICKISGFKKNIRIYTTKNKPLKISIDTGSLGVQNIYLTAEGL